MLILNSVELLQAGRRQGLDPPVVVTVHVCLPVTHVDQDVPLEAGLAGLGVSCPLGTLVVHLAGVGITEMTLWGRTLEVGHFRGRLGDVKVAVPVSSGYGQEIFQSRRSEMIRRVSSLLGLNSESYLGLFCRTAELDMSSLVLGGLSATSLLIIWNSD